MSPIASIQSALQGWLDTVPAAEATRVAAALNEEILWSGPLAAQATVDQGLASSAWFIAWSVALVAFGLGLIASQNAYKGKGRTRSMAAGSALAVAGLLGALFPGFASYGDLARQAERTAIITPNRIVVLVGKEEGRAARTDFPVSAITQVSMPREGKVAIRLAGAGTLEIEREGEDMLQLGQAADRLIRAAGNNSPILREGFSKG